MTNKLFLLLLTISTWFTIPDIVARAQEQDSLPDAEQLIATFRRPADLDIHLWAKEPMLANPVGFTLDERGRVYVAETHRVNHGVTDDRSRMFWLVDDLASRSIEDRLAMYQRYADRVEHGMARYTSHSDRIVVLSDRDGDGHADDSHVFASGFNHA